MSRQSKLLASASKIKTLIFDALPLRHSPHQSALITSFMIRPESVLLNRDYSIFIGPSGELFTGFNRMLADTQVIRKVAHTNCFVIFAIAFGKPNIGPKRIVFLSRILSRIINRLILVRSEIRTHVTHSALISVR